MEAIFFPRNDYPNNVEVCNHRLGKKMTYCECTTDIPQLVQDKMLPYFVTAHNEHHLKVGTYFGWNYPDSAWNTAYGKQQIANGVIYPDLYFYPGNDYSESHILSVWNNSAKPWFVQQFGRVPVAIDFSRGNTSYKQYLAGNFLAADTSFTELNKTDYGVGVGNPNNVPWSLDRYYPRDMNSRVLDHARAHIGDYPEEKDAYNYYINQMASLIDTTLSLTNGGFIMNFSHWHDIANMDYNNDGTPKEGRNDYAINNGFKVYVDMLCQKNVNDEIYFAGYGEAVAYLVYRQSITKAVMYSPVGKENEQLIIRLEAKDLPMITVNRDNEDIVKPIDTDLLQIPISVKFSTAGTPLSNQAIKSTLNLISLGSNQYIVEIPWDKFPEAVIEKNNINQ